MTHKTTRSFGQASMAIATVTAVSSLGTSSAEAASHTVQSGESFYSIATAYGMDTYQLAVNNGKSIYDIINPGDILQVADLPPVTPVSSTHTVQWGESFYSIAGFYGMDAFQLASNNGKSIYDTINPGDVLQVQGTSATLPQTQSYNSSDPYGTQDVEGVILNTPTDYGNSYPIGQCTWAVKELAPWVNNWWGNAKDWDENAIALNGYSVGVTPAVGAIAVWDGGDFGHVAYVTSVASDTSIQVLESNYMGQKQIANYRGWFDPTNAQGRVTYIYPW
ncbi:CHAP domain-containing protein [Streptococcus moroccensis]|uniref:Surface antigen n=1 Tax=Streptococcus moroccensis TaxID=1451356 RepID=A0ABT9YSJ9_9STRE|nr:CHAP domain-containing protein [Streptococcus moroccensis]MDQ0222976.1 surface antigen [Streptococcus moroccensis]